MLELFRILFIVGFVVYGFHGLGLTIGAVAKLISEDKNGCLESFFVGILLFFVSGSLFVGIPWLIAYFIAR